MISKPLRLTLAIAAILIGLVVASTFDKWSPPKIATLYLLPWAIFVISNHSAKLGILILNLFLGWTVIGWIIALYQKSLTLKSGFYHL